MARDSATPPIARTAGICRAPLAVVARRAARVWSAVLALALWAGPAPALDRPIALPPDIEHLVVADDWPLADAGASDAVETARLKAGVLCVAWASDMIDQHWRLLDALEGPGTWTRARQQLWLQIGWIEAFEADYLRPRIDPDSQRALRDVWWPEGAGTPADSEAAETMHRFCRGLPGLLGAIDPRSPYRSDRAFR